MAYITSKAPRFRMGTFITFLHRLKSAFRAKNPRPTPIPNSPRLARDAGLSPQDFAALTHKWPSDTNVHPRW